MWQIEQQIDWQAKGQIGRQINEQVGQIKQKLNESLISGYGEWQITQVSNQIMQKTGIATTNIYGQSCFDFELNGKSYRVYETGLYDYCLNLSGKIYQIDMYGHLANIDDWDKEVASWLASDENIEMTDAHWEVVDFLREYYAEWGIAPHTYMLIKIIKKKFSLEKGNKEYLYKLFPKGAMQAIKIAGLPRPTGGP